MPNLGPIVCMKQGWIYSLFSLFFCLLLLEEGVSGYDYDLKIGTEKTVCYEETGGDGDSYDFGHIAGNAYKWCRVRGTV